MRKPSGEVKLKFLKEIAKEYQVKWDPAESERELLKPPEELIVILPKISMSMLLSVGKFVTNFSDLQIAGRSMQLL